MYWLLGHKSKLSTSNKLLIYIYITILNPIWTYRLWGTASTSNIEILERFQLEVLHMVVDAPWFMLNMVIQRDLQTPTVKKEFRHCSFQYNAHLTSYSNVLVLKLMEQPGNCEDTCQVICLPDSYCTCRICSSSFLSLILKSHNRPRTFLLQGSATGHSSTCLCKRFKEIAECIGADCK
jgi:hypothetical protein